MKKFLLAAIAIFSTHLLFAQVPILYYDFESNSNRNTFENAVEQYINTGSGALTTVGLSNIGGGTGAGTNNGGSANGKSIGATSWSTSTNDPGTNATDYYQFVVNTSGFEGISIAFQTLNETGGPKKLGVLYSTNGTSFSSAVASDHTIENSWGVEYFYLPAAADNKTTVTIRVYGYNATYTNKYMWVDNIIVLANDITSSKTLIDYSALGLSLTSGTTYLIPLSGFNVSGTNTTATLKSPLYTYGAINVENTNTLDCKTYTIYGTGTLTVNSGGTIKIGSTNSADAIDGNIAITTDPVFSSGSTVELNGTAAQYLAARTISNLKINNSYGVTAKGNLSTDDITLTVGTFALGTTSLTSTGDILRTSGTLTTSGSLIFNGASSQNIASGAISGNLKNITVANTTGLSINSAQTIAGTLTLTSGFLSINGQTLTVSGTITGTGTIRGSSASSLTVTSPAGTLKMDATTDGTTNALANLTVNGGSITAGSKLNIYTLLSITSGTFNANGQNIVFKSNSSNTARIGTISTGAYLTNATNITIERYLPNDGRRYRLIAPGVTTTTSMKANWMEGAMNTAIGSNINPAPGYGIQLTGSGGNNNGFDATQTNSASLYTYTQATGAWATVTNTNGVLNANVPYLIFIRGDRSVDMTSTAASLPSSATTLRATGTIKTGDQTLTSLNSNGGMSLISNPFLSPINWATVYSANSTKFENFYTYWEPKIGTRGGYVTVTNSGLKNNIYSSATTEIQSGQAIFVKTKSGVTSPSLVIKETDKSSNSGINVFRTTGGSTEQLSASLFFTDGNGIRTLSDAVVVAFNDNYSASVDDNDATQIANWDEDIAISREGKSLSIETRPPTTGTDSFAINIARLKIQSYEWQFDPSNFAHGAVLAFLRDNFLNTESPISLTSPTTISFSVTSDANSSAVNRFIIILKEIVVLPVVYTGVKAYQQANSVRVEWKTASEQGVSEYEIEKSSDGQNFSKIETQSAKGGAANSYHSIDQTPAAGTNFYRIKAIDATGTYKFSSIVNVKIGNIKPEVVVYPNPMIGNTINLQFVSLAKGKYTVELFNLNGQKLMSHIVDHSGNSATQQLTIDNTIGKGVYQLRITGAGEQWTMQLVR